jgi:hypothetical protein
MPLLCWMQQIPGAIHRGIRHLHHHVIGHPPGKIHHRLSRIGSSIVTQPARTALICAVVGGIGALTGPEWWPASPEAPGTSALAPEVFPPTAEFFPSIGDLFPSVGEIFPSFEESAIAILAVPLGSESAALSVPGSSTEHLSSVPIDTSAPTPVDEPSSLILLCSGLAIWLIVLTRRTARKSPKIISRTLFQSRESKTEDSCGSPDPFFSGRFRGSFSGR